MEELHAEGLANPRRPRVMRGVPRGTWRSVDRGTRRPGYRASKETGQGADALHKAEGNTAGGANREPPGGPAGSENQGMCGTFVRENREVPCLPVRVVCGRAAGGTLRR